MVQNLTMLRAVFADCFVFNMKKPGFLMLLFLYAMPCAALAQTTACDAVKGAHRKNQMVRLTFTDSGSVTGRIQETDCPVARIANRSVQTEMIAQIETRISQADPIWNGVGLGAIAGGAAGTVLGLYASGGDAPIPMAFGVGAGTGAIVGLIVDVIRARPPQWILAWERGRLR
jgi:hypothetical protein